VQEATTAAQQVVYATLATVGVEAAGIAPPAVVVIGDVVRVLTGSEPAPAGFEEEGE
jgi:siroheme synthase